MFRHLSIQLELRYLGMERQTVTFITLRLIIDLGGARSTWLRVCLLSGKYEREVQDSISGSLERQRCRQPGCTSSAIELLSD